MRDALQNLFNFVNDNLGKDNSVIGLSGLKKEENYLYIEIPVELKKTYITNLDKNYLLL